MKQPAFPPRAQIETRRLASRIDRVAFGYDPVRLGTVTGDRLVAAVSTFTFPASYTTGGVILSTLGVPGVVTVRMMPWTDLAGAMYFFSWNGLSRMRVTDWTGVEIANGTDLSAIADHPYDVLGSSSGASASRLTPWRSNGAGRLASVEFEIGAAVSADGSNYWTLTAYLLEAEPLAPQTTGIKLGSYSTAARGAAAGTLLPLYEADESGLRVRPGDRVWVDPVRTGNPAALQDLSIWPLVERSVR